MTGLGGEPPYRMEQENDHCAPLRVIPRNVLGLPEPDIHSYRGWPVLSDGINRPSSRACITNWQYAGRLKTAEPMGILAAIFPTVPPQVSGRRAKSRRCGSQVALRPCGRTSQHSLRSPGQSIVRRCRKKPCRTTPKRQSWHAKGADNNRHDTGHFTGAHEARVDPVVVNPLDRRRVTTNTFHATSRMSSVSSVTVSS
jgi:hypothetical protein